MSLTVKAKKEKDNVNAYAKKSSSRDRKSLTKEYQDFTLTGDEYLEFSSDNPGKTYVTVIKTNSPLRIEKMGDKYLVTPTSNSPQPEENCNVSVGEGQGNTQ